MSPEQVLGKNVDYRTDLFSLGVTFYELLTGHRAFEGEDASGIFYAILNTEVESIHRFCKSLPPGVEGIVEKLLEKDPAYRYQSAEEVQTDILRLSSDKAISSSTSVKSRNTLSGRIRATSRRTALRRSLMAVGMIGLLAIIASLVWPDSAVKTFSGTLGSGSSESITGQLYDIYTIRTRAGDHVVANMISSEFDTYLRVQSPTGRKADNNDYQGSISHSRVELDITESGTWQIMATSHDEGAMGSYVITVTFSKMEESTASETRIERGMLVEGDETLVTGEFRDSYTIDCSRGEKIVLDLQSSEFDPYLMVFSPGGGQYENDDHEGDANRSLLSLDPTEEGTYTIYVTSYDAGETGNYDLSIWKGSMEATAAEPRIESGELVDGDETLRTGEYMDSYTFEGIPGQRARLDLSSTEFDTYLILKGPGEFNLENDDIGEDPDHSVIDVELPEKGTYRVIVTSFDVGETGRYGLTIHVGGAGGPPDLMKLDVGGKVAGRLEQGDVSLESGEFLDEYVFEGSAGQKIVIEMTSTDFDTYLVLVFPSGETVENDDVDEGIGDSRLELVLPETGRYQVMATTYEGGLTGSYRISLDTAEAAGSGSDPAPVTGTGRVYGIFVGISDYQGEGLDLLYTADDARKVHQAMIDGAGLRPVDGVVIVDSEATVDNIRDTFQRLGGQVTENDLFIFFFSGYGDRRGRSSFQSTDPDDLDEEIVLYDGSIADDELSDLFGLISSRISMVIIDASFSGGFSNDVISAPGRMGLFSCEEDVISSVAVKFKAGGFLAPFLADAIGERQADTDGDNQLSVGELSDYLDNRYRTSVRAGGIDDNIRTGGPQLGYQNLVTNHGSMGPSVILFPLIRDDSDF